jgi:hypothetical protein
MADDRDVIACDKCGKPEHLELLDSKDDGSGNFTILQCVACYGPGWNPMATRSFSKSTRPDLAPLYNAWRNKHG